MHEKRKSCGVHTSSHKPMKKVYDENETKKKTMYVIHGRKPFITPIQEIDESDLHKLQVNDYGYNEGTICLVNWCYGDGFLSVGTQTGTIKLAMAGTQDWWCRFLHCWLVDSTVYG